MVKIRSLEYHKRPLRENTSLTSVVNCVDFLVFCHISRLRLNKESILLVTRDFFDELKHSDIYHEGKIFGLYIHLANLTRLEFMFATE